MPCSSRHGHRLLCWVALALWPIFFSFASAADAQERPAVKAVALVADPAVMPLARRLQQELESLGLVVRFEPQARVAPRATREGLAIIRVVSTHGGDIDVTLIDGANGKTTYQVVSPSTAAPAASELIATRIVELLRAHLLELNYDKAPRPKPVVPVSKAPRAARSSRPLLSISLGPSALFTERFRPGAQLQAQMVWLPERYFGLTGAVLAPLTAPRLSTREGSVELTLVSYRLAPTALVGTESSPVSLRAELGVEMNRLSFEGRALAPYRSATDDLTAWAPFVAIAPRFRTFRSLYLAPAFSFAWASPSTTIRIAGSEAATFGRPASRIALLLELSWPGGMP